jgi:hypothetical protein
MYDPEGERANRRVRVHVQHFHHVPAARHETRVDATALNWPRFVIPEPTDEIISTDGNNEQRHCRLVSLLPRLAISLENRPYENKRLRGKCFLRQKLDKVFSASGHPTSKLPDEK